MRNGAPRVTADQVAEFVDYVTAKANGRMHARKERQIVADLRLGKHGDRLIRALVNAANSAGHLVCTGNAGYWIASSPDDIRETTGRLRSQARKMLRRADEIERQAARKFKDMPPAAHKRRRDVSELQMTLV